MPPVPSAPFLTPSQVDRIHQELEAMTAAAAGRLGWPITMRVHHEHSQTSQILVFTWRPKL